MVSIVIDIFCYLYVQPARVGLLFASWLFNLPASFDTSKISLFIFRQRDCYRRWVVRESNAARENLASEDYLAEANRQGKI